MNKGSLPRNTNTRISEPGVNTGVSYVYGNCVGVINQKKCEKLQYYKLGIFSFCSVATVRITSNWLC